jgi:acetolactate synthase-1/3 small subunit
MKIAVGPGAPNGPHSRSQIYELANVFRARVVDLAPESIMLEMTGSSSKIEGLVQVITESGYTILEVSRTGRMAMRRGHHTSRVLSALGSRPKADGNGDNHGSKLDFHGNLGDEILPNEFENVHEEEI